MSPTGPPAFLPTSGQPQKQANMFNNQCVTSVCVAGVVGQGHSVLCWPPCVVLHTDQAVLQSLHPCPATHLLSLSPHVLPRRQRRLVQDVHARGQLLHPSIIGSLKFCSMSSPHFLPRSLYHYLWCSPSQVLTSSLLPSTITSDAPPPKSSLSPSFPPPLALMLPSPHFLPPSLHHWLRCSPLPSPHFLPPSLHHWLSKIPPSLSLPLSPSLPLCLLISPSLSLSLSTSFPPFPSFRTTVVFLSLSYSFVPLSGFQFCVTMSNLG